MSPPLQNTTTNNNNKRNEKQQQGKQQRQQRNIQKPKQMVIIHEYGLEVSVKSTYGTSLCPGPHCLPHILMLKKEKRWG